MNKIKIHLSYDLIIIFYKKKGEMLLWQNTTHPLQGHRKVEKA